MARKKNENNDVSPMIMDGPVEQKTFEMGDVVVFDPTSFNPSYWNGLTEEEKVKYYGDLGYGRERRHLFTFITIIKAADGTDSGHCILISLENQKVETMRHTCDFRKATDEEF